VDPGGTEVTATDEHVASTTWDLQIQDVGDRTQVVIEWSCSCGFMLVWGTPLHTSAELERDYWLRTIEIEGASFELRPRMERHLQEGT
jgi:hypothetical protein